MGVFSLTGLLTKHARIVLVLVSLTLETAFPAYAMAAIYSWQDEQGRKFFGDKKIGGIGQKKINLDVQLPDWQRFDINIEDVGSVLTESEKRRISNDVNSVYHFFDQKLYLHLYKTLPVKIRLFPDSIGYQEYIDAIEPIKQKTRGVYVRSTNEIVVYLQGIRERTFWTIKHEVSHAIVDRLTSFVPAWLDEGIAENMESITLEDGKLQLMAHEENHHHLLQSLAGGDVLDIAGFMDMNSAGWREKNQDASMQVQSGELVRLLLSSSSGIKLLTRLIHYYKRGNRDLSSEFTNEHYIGGLNALQNKWSGWKKRKNTRVIEF